MGDRDATPSASGGFPDHSAVDVAVDEVLGGANQQRVQGRRLPQRMPACSRRIRGSQNLRMCVGDLDRRAVGGRASKLRTRSWPSRTTGGMSPRHEPVIPGGTWIRRWRSSSAPEAASRTAMSAVP